MSRKITTEEVKRDWQAIAALCNKLKDAVPGVGAPAKVSESTKKK